MLRVGLTGNLGSGKSTVAAMFAERGADVLSSDSIGRDLMQPGQVVFERIIAHFGAIVLRPDGALDRAALARIAFADGRVEELNAIVHPAVIAHQAVRMAEIFAATPEAVVIIESALIFETQTAAAARFDCILLVTAPEPEKIGRFVRRQSPDGVVSSERRKMLEAEALRRLSMQLPDRIKAGRCDHVIANDGSLDHLEAQVERLWPILSRLSRQAP